MAIDGMKQFKIEEIASISDGELAHEINMAIHQAYLDCSARPGVGAARKITLEISLSPLVKGTELYRVDTGFVIKKALPPQGVVVAMRPGSNGLEFRPDNPDNPDQRSLFDGDSGDAAQG